MPPETEVKLVLNSSDEDDAETELHNIAAIVNSEPDNVAREGLIEISDEPADETLGSRDACVKFECAEELLKVLDGTLESDDEAGVATVQCRPPLEKVVLYEVKIVGFTGSPFYTVTCIDENGNREVKVTTEVENEVQGNPSSEHVPVDNEMCLDDGAIESETVEQSEPESEHELNSNDSARMSTEARVTVGDDQVESNLKLQTKKKTRINKSTKSIIAFTLFNKKYACEHCKISFAHRSVRNQHFEEIHKICGPAKVHKFNLTCQTCGTSFPIQKSLRSHVCLVDPEVSRAKKTLRIEDTKRTENLKKTVPSQVEIIAPSGSNLQSIAQPAVRDEFRPEPSNSSKQLTKKSQYTVIHRKFLCLVCKHCDIEFSSKKKSDRHFNSVHGIQGAEQIRKLNRTCKVCGMEYKELVSLWRHLKINHPEVAKITEEPFIPRYVMDKGWLCCGKLYDTSVKLYSHRRDHHPSTIKKIEKLCHLCNVLFENSSKRFVHYKTVHQNLTENAIQKLSFRCNLCNKTSKNTRLLLVHKKKLHWDVIIENSSA